MKIDRLIGIIMYMLNREVVSASVLAQKFEVSKRTIQRDIDVLNQAGIPIVSMHGTNGGYEILDGFKLVKSIIDVDDYLNIIIGLKGFSTVCDNNKIDATLEKIQSSKDYVEQKN